MSGFDNLARCAGTWQGTNRLHDPSTNAPDDSPSTLTATPILHGMFLRVDYNWVYEGVTQEGTFLIGYKPKTEAITAYWADTWHMGRTVMVCQGSTPAPPDGDGALNVLGYYGAPTGPDWGWRTILQPRKEGSDEALRMFMYNITPDGEEAIAVEATYTRTEQKE